jgi:hypothetical protein
MTKETHERRKRKKVNLSCDKGGNECYLMKQVNRVIYKIKKQPTVEYFSSVLFI